MLFDATDGSIQLGNLPTLTGPTLSRDEARVAFAARVRDECDVGTGYRWLSLDQLSLGGAPAGISLCFHGQQLHMVTMSVCPPRLRQRQRQRPPLCSENLKAAPVGRLFGVPCA